jgi:hypothetical protein
MSRRAATILWVAMAVASAACLLGLWLVLSLPHAMPLDIETGGNNSPFAFLGLGALLAVGGVILWHRPGHTIGWLYSLSGLLTAVAAFCTGYGDYAAQVPGVLPGADIAVAVSGVAFFGGIGFPVTLGLLLFPDGRPPSRRWWPVVALPILAILVASIVAAFPHATIAEVANGSLQIVLPLAILASAASIVHRWRHARGDARQQLKWVAGAGLGVIAAVAASIVVGVAAPGTGAEFVIFTVGFSFLPIAVGIAIVRHRLYDIDLIIKRSLVYGTTSATIGATFFVGIVALQAILSPITSGSDIAVAASTLLSFALFQPIRRRVQGAVDERFDRSRYDAAHTLDTFADDLRDEVDLDTLRSELLGAVNRTMSPAHASLWLRERTS